MVGNVLNESTYYALTKNFSFEFLFFLLISHSLKKMYYFCFTKGHDC